MLAFDLARMLTLRKSLSIAITVATKERRYFLAEKLGILLVCTCHTRLLVVGAVVVGWGFGC